MQSESWKLKDFVCHILYSSKGYPGMSCSFVAKNNDLVNVCLNLYDSFRQTPYQNICSSYYTYYSSSNYNKCYIWSMGPVLQYWKSGLILMGFTQ